MIILNELLLVVDGLDEGLKALANNDSSSVWLEGFQIVHERMIAFLRKKKYSGDRVTTELTLRDALKQYENFYKIKITFKVF